MIRNPTPNSTNRMRMPHASAAIVQRFVPALSRRIDHTERIASGWQESNPDL
jgi:hypothetical protein